MGYLDFLLQSPRFWIFLTAFFLGAGLSRLVLLGIARDRRAARQRRRVTASLVFASLAVIAFTLGIFLPAEVRLFESGMLIYGGLAVLAFLLVFSFFRYLLAPLALLVAVGLVGAIYLGAPWEPVREEQVLATVRVLGLDDEGFSAEILAPDVVPETRMIDGTGTAMAAEAEVIRYAPAYFLLGRRTAVRLLALEAYVRSAEGGEGGDWERGERLDLEPASAVARDAYREPARRVLSALPGIRVESLRTEIRPLRLLERYDILATPAGDLVFAAAE